MQELASRSSTPTTVAEGEEDSSEQDDNESVATIGSGVTPDLANVTYPRSDAPSSSSSFTLSDWASHYTDDSRQLSDDETDNITISPACSLYETDEGTSE